MEKMPTFGITSPQTKSNPIDLTGFNDGMLIAKSQRQAAIDKNY